MKTYSKIKGLSDSRRMPRLSKIRLGAKIEKIIGTGDKQKSVEYPIELPFFLLPDDVAAVHGGKIQDIEARAKALGVNRADALKFIKENGHRLAEELPVMIPVEDTNYSFPQSYKLYGGSIGLKCIGDGETAQERFGPGREDWHEIKCPCDKLKSDENPRGECTIKAHLSVMLPDVSAGGVYQIDIGSINSIVDINSGIDYIQKIIWRVSMIPLKLRRIPTETHHDGKKQIHYTCQLTFAGNIHAISEMRENHRILTHNQILKLEEPDYSDPKEDAPDMQYVQPEHIKNMLDELKALAEAKKVLKSEGLAIRDAIDLQDDDMIEKIYNQVKSRNSGKTQDETAAKLKQKAEETNTKQTIDEIPNRF